NVALSKVNVCWGLQSALDQHPEGPRQRLAFRLDDRRVLLQQTCRKFGPGRHCHRESIWPAAKNQRVRAVQCSASRVLEIFFGGIDHREVETWFQKLQQGIAFYNERRWFPAGIASGFL